jgi:hypothetical protein
MATTRENFDSWFAKIIRNSYEDDDAGYMRVMLAFQLLERYVRLKVQCLGDLKGRFYDEIASLIPKLERDRAREFWDIYRNKLLHRVTSRGWLSALETPVLYSNGNFQLDSVKFPKRVLEIIESDFTTFEGERMDDKLPTVQKIPLSFNSWSSTATVGMSDGTALPFIPSNGSVLLR